MMALDPSPQFPHKWIFVPLVPTCEPQGVASFDPKGHHMNEIDKGLQGDATYQNLSSIPSSFRENEFWSWSSSFLCSNLWPQRNHMNKTDKGPQRDAKYQISKL